MFLIIQFCSGKDFAKHWKNGRKKISKMEWKIETKNLFAFYGIIIWITNWVTLQKFSLIFKVCFYSLLQNIYSSIIKFVSFKIHIHIV